MGLITDGSRDFAAWMAEGPPEERGQPVVARLIGVSQPTVSNWARAVAVPAYHWRVALRALTGIAIPAWDRPADKRALAAALRRIGGPGATAET